MLTGVQAYMLNDKTAYVGSIINHFGMVVGWLTGI